MKRSACDTRVRIRVWPRCRRRPAAGMDPVGQRRFGDDSSVPYRFPADGLADQALSISTVDRRRRQWLGRADAPRASARDFVGSSKTRQQCYIAAFAGRFIKAISGQIKPRQAFGAPRASWGPMGRILPGDRHWHRAGRRRSPARPTPPYWTTDGTVVTLATTDPGACLRTGRSPGRWRSRSATVER